MRRRGPAGLVLSLLAGLLVNVGFGVVEPERAAAACAAEASSEAAASAMAAACGQRVEVAQGRSEYTQVFAKPDGGFTMESAVVPQRTRRADGTWAGVDLALRQANDGTWRPGASVADVRFSGGGSGPLVTLVRGGKSLTVSWPAALPAPSVVGDSATYAGVFTDVDLVVRATRTGFTHVLVIKSPQAAANPAVRTVHWDLGGDATVSRRLDGSLQAVADGVLLATSESAIMWDSKSVTAATSSLKPAEVQTEGMAGADESTAAASGDGANTAQVQTAITSDGDLRLTPDVSLFSADPNDYPLFVDPPWSVPKSTWAYAASNGETNDTTYARVGKNPDGGALYRSFFVFPTTDGTVSLAGKYIQSAYVQMKLYHSYSCGDTPVYMYSTNYPNATPKATWSKMSVFTKESSVSAHANKGDGCSDSPQPDVTKNFTGDAVTAHIQGAANQSWTTAAFAFCACSDNTGTGESTTDRWKKFYPGSASLVVDYDSKPTVPVSMQVNGNGCPANTTDRMTINVLTPKLSAILPDLDKTQSLTPTFEWVKLGSPTDTITDATPRQTGLTDITASAPAGGRVEATTPTLSLGTTYAFRVTGKDPAPYLQSSPPSQWCRFAVDPSRPDAAKVTPVGTIGAAGTTLSFSFAVADPQKDMAKFRYGWTTPPLLEVAAIKSPDGVQEARSSSAVALTIPRYGQNILYVEAVDGVGNIGNEGRYEFTAADPTQASEVWGLQTNPGINQTAALRSDTTGKALTVEGNLTWLESDGNGQHVSRMIGAQAATFNATDTALATSGPVVDTTKSFTVSAWVRPTFIEPVGDRNAVGQDGANTNEAGGFYLGMRRDSQGPHWSFQMHNSPDKMSQSTPVFDSKILTDADLGKWVHLAGVYDAGAKEVRLYVNGQQKAHATRSTQPWAATGAFTIGRTFWGGKGNYWPGQIADVRVWNRALVNDDFDRAAIGVERPEEVGRWDFSAAAGCVTPGDLDACPPAADGSGLNHPLTLEEGTDIQQSVGVPSPSLDLDHAYFPDYNMDGHWTNEFATSAGPVLRTDGSFSVSAWVRPDGDLLAYNKTVLGQDASMTASLVSGFYLQARAEIDPADNIKKTRWCLLMIDGPQSGAGGKLACSQQLIASAADPTIAQAVVGHWTFLAAVYDAARGEMRLYVDGSLAATTGQFTADAAWQADGRFTVGRARYYECKPVCQGSDVDFWLGGIDSIRAYQGALTDVDVAAKFVSEPQG